MEKQLDFRAEREGRDKKERDDKKRAFKNLVRPMKHDYKWCGMFNIHIRRKQRSKRRRSERRQPS